MSKMVKVALRSEIPSDTGKQIEIEGREIALFKVDGKIFALSHICPHQGGPLAEGGVEGGVVTCPWHGWQFDVRTGVCTFNDSIKQETFKVEEKGEDIYVEV